MKAYYESFPDVKQVIHSKAYTVVMIDAKYDGKTIKGVTRCRPGTKRDPEKGFWIAYAKAQRSAVKFERIYGKLCEESIAKKNHLVSAVERKVDKILTWIK